MSREFHEALARNESLRQEVARAIRCAAGERWSGSRDDVARFVSEANRDGTLREELIEAVSAVAGRHGLAFDPDEPYEGELSERQLELVAGGAASAELAVLDFIDAISF